MTTPHLTPETLTDYAHGELAPADDALAHAHLAACAACRIELERETALVEQLRRAAAQESFELPASVKAAIRQKLRDARTTPFPWVLTTLRPAMISLPIAAAILIGTLAFPPLMHAIRPAQPTIDLAFYLDAHAAQQASEPLSEHNPMPASLQTSSDANASGATTDAIEYASTEPVLADDVVR